MTSTQIEVKDYRYFAGNQWRKAADDQFFEVHEPYSGQLFARVAAGSRADARAAVDAAAKAFPAWADSKPSERAGLFLKSIRDRQMPSHRDRRDPSSRNRIHYFIFDVSDGLGCGHASAGRRVGLSAQGRSTGNQFGRTHSIGLRRPLGVCASFTPWNGANILSWRAVISPVAAGNTVVVKPSEFAPVSAGIMLAEVAEEAGFPAGVINIITHAPGTAGAIADEFFDRPEVWIINLIGGLKTARMLSERAGRTLKRTVMELGGFNPMIIFDDVDMNYAVRTATFGSFFHQGQICLNTRRIIIQRKTYEEFLEKFAARTQTLPAGDPLDPKTIIGPIITREAVKLIDQRVQEAIASGAKAHTGAKHDGQIYYPTILTDVPLDAAIANEETFGPVVVVEVVDTPEDAIAAANRTLYGLTSSILSGNTYKAFEMAPKALAGIVNVNSPTVNDEIHAPMGGVRDSGWGRTGPRSLDDFSDVIWINSHSGQRQYPVLIENLFL
jgi:acyl-CoA reductase-like NAD-dependent aldehyde dehydrogenase